MIPRLVERWYGPWMIAKNYVSSRILGGSFAHHLLINVQSQHFLRFESTCPYLKTVEMWHSLGVVHLCQEIEGQGQTEHKNAQQNWGDTQKHAVLWW